MTKRIKIYGELVGVEIDRIKTGEPPQKPTSWEKKRCPKEQFVLDEDSGLTYGSSQKFEDEVLEARKHNSLIPSKKPMFMRYIYDSLDREINRYNKAFNDECRNYGMKLEELLSVPYDEMSDSQRKTVDRYHHLYPAIDSDCNMNKICRQFENIQRNTKIGRGAKNMLPLYVSPQKYDRNTKNEIGHVLDSFVRQRNLILKNAAQKKHNNKTIANDSKERFEILNGYVRERIFDCVGGDIQSAYNYLVKLMQEKRCGESVVWAIMDNLMFEIIPKKEVTV